jgi:transposase-like protein
MGLKQNIKILRIDLSKERNMFIAERFLSNLLKEYVKHPDSTGMVAHGIHKLANF